MLPASWSDEKDIEQYCEDAVDECEEFFQALEHPEMGTQASALLLRYCAIPRLGYLSRTTHPDRLRHAARRFDERTLTSFQRITHITDEELHALDQSESEHKQDGAPVSAVTREQLLLRMSLPIRLGGLGLRPVSRILTAAYYSALMAALPELLRMCPDLRSTGEGPEGHSQQVRATELYAELAELREKLLASGAFNRRQRRQHVRDAAAVHAPTMQVRPNAQPPDPPPPGLSLALPSISASAPAAAPAAATAAPAATPAPPAAASAADVATSTSSSSFSVLKKDTDALWTDASQLAQGGIDSLACKCMPALQLQQKITEALEVHLHEKTHTTLGPYQQTIVTSLSSAAQSGAFLSVLPTERAYRMTDEQMCLAIRDRLGMLPAISLRTESCVSCHGRNTVHEPRFEDDPAHFQACLGRAPPGASVTSRHHRIAGEVVAHCARQKGYTVVREPLFDSVVATTTAVDPMTGVEFDQEQVFHDQERGDLLLIRGDELLLIDVTIVRPTAPTHLRNPRLKVTTCGLACAAAAERAKHVKYDALCKERGWQMIPFAVEAHGAVGESARQLLHKLASKVDDTSAHAFLQDAYARLSVALQSANAAIAIGGLQRLRVNQLSADLPMSPGLGQRAFPSRRRIARHIAEVHSSRVNLSAAFHGVLGQGAVAAAA